jgi:multidrug resistance efflux pump
MLLKYLMPVLAAVALALSLFSVQRMTPSTVQAQPPSPPPAAAFPNQLGAVGLIEAASENIAVSLPVPGLVTRVAVAAGQQVKQGQLLFALDDRDLRAELNLRRAAVELARTRLQRLAAAPRPEEIPPAQARVAEAQAQVADATEQLKRIESVTDPRAVRREDVDRRRRALDGAQARLAEAQASLKLIEAGSWQQDIAIARAELAQAEAQVARIEADLERLQVRAPIAGVILQCKVRPGEFAQAGVLAQPLILLGQTDPLHVRADIDEKDAWRFRPGSPAKGAVRGNAAQSFSLDFVRVEPYVVPKRNLTGDATERVDSRVLQVIYRLPSGTQLYPGQQVDLSIEAPAEAR